MKTDIVNKASHYNQHLSGIECKEIAHYLMFPFASALKYLWRMGDKEYSANGVNGETLDKQKAIYYLKDCIDFINDIDDQKFIALVSFQFFNRSTLSKLILVSEYEAYPFLSDYCKILTVAHFSKYFSDISQLKIFIKNSFLLLIKKIEKSLENKNE